MNCAVVSYLKVKLLPFLKQIFQKHVHCWLVSLVSTIFAQLISGLGNTSCNNDHTSMVNCKPEMAFTISGNNAKATFHGNQKETSTNVSSFHFFYHQWPENNFLAYPHSKQQQ